MELDAENRMFAMLEPHDLALFGASGDGQRRILIQFDDEGVVARGAEPIGEASENPFPAVADLGGFAVKRPLGADNSSAESLADALVAEADAENGELARKLANHGKRYSRLIGRAGPR